MEITLRAISSPIFSESLCLECANKEPCDLSNALVGITNRKGWSYPALDVVRCDWFTTELEAKIIDESNPER